MNIIERLRVMRKRWIILSVLILILLLPTGGIEYDDGFVNDRWQFHYRTMLWDFTIDRTPNGHNEGWGVYLRVPDEHCYEHLGGRTGSVGFTAYAVPGDTFFMVRINAGDWWGDMSRFTYCGVKDGPGIGNWCIPIFCWSSD